MTRSLALFAMLVVSATSGCKKQEAEAAAPSPLVGQLATLADAGCACKDAACATQVRADVQKLGEGAGKIADADLPALRASQAKLDECLAQLEPLVVDYRELTAQVCACKDKACAKKVSAAFSKWAADLKKSGKKLAPSDAQLIMASGKQAAECLNAHGLPVPQ